MFSRQNIWRGGELLCLPDKSRIPHYGAAEICERFKVFLPTGNVVPKPQPVPFQQMSLRKDILLAAVILVAQRELSLRQDNWWEASLWNCLHAQKLPLGGR